MRVRERGRRGLPVHGLKPMTPTQAAYLPVRSRCLHPGQQHGRRWPSSSSSWVRRIRRSRVLSCLASSTQQMNSLRAKGVMSFQASSAVALAISALHRSAGSSCTTPPGTLGPLIGPIVVSRLCGIAPLGPLAQTKRQFTLAANLTPSSGQHQAPPRPGRRFVTATLNNMPAAVPCYVYLRGDPDAVHCNEAPDEVLRRIEGASPDEFVHLAMTALAHDDAISDGLRQSRGHCCDPPDASSAARSRLGRSARLVSPLVAARQRAWCSPKRQRAPRLLAAVRLRASFANARTGCSSAMAPRQGQRGSARDTVGGANSLRP